jgi:spore coat protein U-like protein
MNGKIQNNMVKKLAILGVGVLAMAMGAQASQAATAQANLIIHAEVGSYGAISGATLEFGNYTTGQSSPLDATASIPVNVSNGTNWQISFGQGLYGTSATDRKMETSPGNTLNYNIYSSPGNRSSGSTVLGDGSTGDQLTGTGTGSVDSTNKVYGRVFASQTAATGDYNDTVVMTLNY